MIHSFKELREGASAVRPQTVAVACAHDAHTLRRCCTPRRRTF